MSHQSLEFAMESIKKYTDYIMEYLDGEEREESLKKMQNLMKTACDIENTRSASGLALKDLTSEVKRRRNKKKKLDRNRNESVENEEEEEEEEDGTLEHVNVREIYAAKLEERMQKTGPVEQCQRYVEFTNRLKLLASRNDGDNEIAFVSDEVNTIDMISKKMMVNPVRIKQCGHSFERSSILSLLKRKPYIRCPMPGCMETRVKASDLEENLQLKRVLEQQSAKSN